MGLDKPYLDIPGTTVFDLDQSRKGYQLNQFCMSLMRPENRERFQADELAYLDEWDLSDEQKQGVIDRDLNRLIELGGNVYMLAKIGASEGLTYLEIVSSMTDLDVEAYRDMMLSGGRPIDGNRHVDEWERGGGPVGRPAPDGTGDDNDNDSDNGSDSDDDSEVPA